MKTTIESILEAYDAKGHPALNPVIRTESLASNGRWYGWGFPHGCTDTGERRSYWVHQMKDGSTVGKRFESREAFEAFHATNRREKRELFRVELEAMTPERIDSQAEYWLGLVNA